jgi:hypothetical protein
MQETKGVWERNLEHEGLQVSHAQKPSQEIINKLKVAGFRWSRMQRLWYANETSERVKLLNEIAEYAGETGTKKTFAEKMEAKLERAESRAERYEELAEKTDAKGHEILNQAHKMAEIIPFGQPIHGAADRNYRDKIHNKQGRGFETLEKAEYFEQRAEAAAKFEDRTFNLGTTLRRIAKLEAQIRSDLLASDRHIFEWEGDLNRFRSGLDDKRWTLLSRKHLEYIEARIPPIQEQIDYWKSIVKQKQEEEGLKVWGPSDFKRGEQIRARGARAVIKRINPKSVTVEYIEPGKEWMNNLDILKVPYNELGQKCKEVA